MPTANDIKLTGAGDVLRELREQAGLGLREAATELGWNPGELSKYETNKVGVSLDIVEKIAKLVKKPAEAVVLQCLQTRYKTLSTKDTPVGKALGQLLKAIDNSAK